MTLIGLGKMQILSHGLSGDGPEQSLGGQKSRKIRRVERASEQARREGGKGGGTEDGLGWA